MKQFIALILLTSLLFAYPYRDIHTPPIQLDDDITIICLGLPRTGSTVIYNVIRYLFENRSEEEKDHAHPTKTFKAHFFNDVTKNYRVRNNVIVCHSIRDPMNMIASVKACCGGVSTGRFTDPMKFIPRRSPYAIKVLTFQFEKFNNDGFEHIYEVIEEGFRVSIPKHAKTEIYKNFSIAAGKKIQSQLDGFKEYDAVSGIHGNHINQCSWQKILTLKQAKRAYKNNYILRKKWGYDDIDIEEEWTSANSGN